MSEFFPIILMIVAATCAGLIGSFALMRRMALAGDAISHVALPGIGIALLLKINPVLGGAAALLLGSLLIWQLERKTSLATESIIGIVFTASLAIGALITPSEEIVEALFGNFGKVNTWLFGLSMAAAALVIIFVATQKNKMVLSLLSPELARTSGVNIDRMNLLFILSFSLTVILGLQFLGALLMGSLIIVPAAIARQLSHSFRGFLITSAISAIFSVLLGFAVANIYGLALGPTVVAVATLLFLLSLLKGKN